MNWVHISGLKVLPSKVPVAPVVNLFWMSVKAWTFFSRYEPIMPCIAWP